MNLPEFEKPPGAVALDLDGTLFNSHEEISPRNRKALEQCLERGIPVILATSRPARLFHRVFPDDLVKLCSYAVMNGAVAAGCPPLSGYFKEPVPGDIIREILGIALKAYPELRITIEIDGFEFGANWTADAETLWERNSATPDMVLSIEESIKLQPSKIALGGIGTEILNLMKILNENISNPVAIVPALAWRPMLNITSPYASKSQALRRLLEPAGISLENVVALGDDLPDIDMLAECGFGIAMDNAFPDVKAACRYSTAGNDDDGVAVVLERFLILEREMTGNT